MGTSLHSILALEVDGKYEPIECDIFGFPGSDLMGALAGIRSSMMQPLYQPRGFTPEMRDMFGEHNNTKKKLPQLDLDGIENDMPYFIGEHSFSYLTVDELESLIYKIKDETPTAVTACCCPCHENDPDYQEDNRWEIEVRELTVKRLRKVLANIIISEMNYQRELAKAVNVILLFGFSS